jgi:ClpP class serine protease
MVVEHLDGSVTEITPQMAKQMMDLYKKINEANKAKMQDMLEASAKHFQTIAKFSKE